MKYRSMRVAIGEHPHEAPWNMVNKLPIKSKIYNPMDGDGEFWVDSR